MLIRTILLQMASNRSLESFARHNRAAAAIARRFIAGETIDEIASPISSLNKKGMSVTLDFLGESVTSESLVESTLTTYKKLFDLIRSQNLNANVSVKLTALGLDISEETARRSLLSLLDYAGDIFIRLDMEGSSYTQRTLDLFMSIWNERAAMHNMGVVIQSYLHRSERDIRMLNSIGARVRLCKGAYKESAPAAFVNKEEVDSNFVLLMKLLLKEGYYPGIATHDTRMIDATISYAKEMNISSNDFEFQMLYGVRRSLQEDIIKQGYRLRIYTPFGDYWYPYTMRRLAERPSNLMFALKSIFKG